MINSHANINVRKSQRIRKRPVFTKVEKRGIREKKRNKSKLEIWRARERERERRREAETPRYREERTAHQGKKWRNEKKIIKDRGVSYLSLLRKLKKTTNTAPISIPADCMCISGWKEREEEKREEEYRKGGREGEGEGEACREIYLCDPRALFVAPLSKDEALEAFAQTAAS